MSYLGLAVNPQFMVIPEVAYLTTLDREVNGYKVDSYDIWLAGVAARLRF